MGSNQCFPPVNEPGIVRSKAKSACAPRCLHCSSNEQGAIAKPLKLGMDLWLAAAGFALLTARRLVCVELGLHQSAQLVADGGIAKALDYFVEKTEHN